MPLLLVDDRKGRIVAEVQTFEQVRQVVEAWLYEDRRIPDYVCPAKVDGHHGSVVATETSVKVRLLS